MKLSFSSVLKTSLLIIGSIFASGNALAKASLAQVTTDNTVNTQVNQNGSVAEITGGETRGDNLFHSFTDFSVPTNNEAFFNNADNISNIFSRVTGGNISNIDGAIRANGNANLFLINPAGIIFGENARLDIGGSFYGSSASSILFEDGEFSAADLENPPILTVNAPIGLGFRDNPGDITYSSIANDAITENQNDIALVGGNVNLNGGNITTPGSKVEIGGLTEAGTVNIAADGSLGFPDGVEKGDISLTDSARVEVISGGGGSIAINAKNFTVTDRSALIAGIDSELGSVDDQAGGIIIDATDSTTLDNSFIFNLREEDALGNIGDINITTSNLILNNESGITTITAGQGNGSTILIKATELVQLDNDSSINIFNSSSERSDTTGNLTIFTKNLAVLNSSLISASTLGQGDGGSIQINAIESVEIRGRNDTDFSARIINTVEPEAVGNAGQIEIITSELSIADEGEISTNSRGVGNAGSIFVKADNLSLNNGGIEARNIPAQEFRENESLEQSIAGGNITLEIANNLTLRSSGISSAAGSRANGGNINIDAKYIIAFPSNSVILAVAERGRGGNITINAKSVLGIEEVSISFLENLDAPTSINVINASSEFSLDGNITINTPDINPVQDAIELPTNIVELGETAQQACKANGEAAKNRLNIEGRGGTSPEPGLPLNSLNVTVNGEATSPTISQPIEDTQAKIQPARGVKITESGETILTAYRTNSSGDKSIPARSRSTGLRNCDL